MNISLLNGMPDVTKAFVTPRVCCGRPSIDATVTLRRRVFRSMVGASVSSRCSLSLHAATHSLGRFVRLGFT